jgi:hypothetical protein
VTGKEIPQAQMASQILVGAGNPVHQIGFIVDQLDTGCGRETTAGAKHLRQGTLSRRGRAAAGIDGGKGEVTDIVGDRKTAVGIGIGYDNGLRRLEGIEDVLGEILLRYQTIGAKLGAGVCHQFVEVSSL